MHDVKISCNDGYGSKTKKCPTNVAHGNKEFHMRFLIDTRSDFMCVGLEDLGRLSVPMHKLKALTLNMQKTATVTQHHIVTM